MAAETKKAPKLERGMLLLEPADELGKPTIWAVAGHERTKPALVACLPEILVRKTLKRNALPTGWTVLENRPLAEMALNELNGDDDA